MVSSIISDLVPFLTVCQEPAPVRGDRDPRGIGLAQSSLGFVLLINQFLLHLENPAGTPATLQVLCSPGHASVLSAVHNRRVL